MSERSCDTCAWSEWHEGELGNVMYQQAPEPGYHVSIFDRSMILLDNEIGEDQPCWMPPIDAKLDDIINMEDLNDE